MTNRTDWQTSISVAITGFSADRMKDLEQSSIRFMELTGSDYPQFDHYVQNAKEIFNTAAGHGVAIRSLHLPFSPFADIDPASGDPHTRSRFLEIQRPLLSAASESGITIAVVHPSGEPYSEAERGDRLACATESLAALQEIAAACGMKLAVENLPRTCIGRNSDEMNAIFRSVPELYACFDANHSLKEDNAAFIRALGERIIALHISDYDFINERHLFPGLGLNRWQDILEALEEVNYSGTWNYEIRDALTYPAEKFAQNYRDLLSGVIK